MLRLIVSYDEFVKSTPGVIGNTDWTFSPDPGLPFSISKLFVFPRAIPTNGPGRRVEKLNKKGMTPAWPHLDNKKPERG